MNHNPINQEVKILNSVKCTYNTRVMLDTRWNFSKNKNCA